MRVVKYPNLKCVQYDIIISHVASQSNDGRPYYSLSLGFLVEVSKNEIEPPRHEHESGYTTHNGNTISSRYCYMLRRTGILNRYTTSGVLSPSSWCDNVEIVSLPIRSDVGNVSVTISINKFWPLWSAHGRLFHSNQGFSFKKRV
jgi:hypothetical protein